MKTKCRFIENGPAVVCIATKKYFNPFNPESQIIVKAKAIAKVNTESGDQYNSEIGKRLAALRAEVKLVEKYNKIMTKYKQYFLDHINPIIDNSLEELEDSRNELTEYLKTI